MSLTDLVSRNDTGLTSDGITKVVSRYCEFDAPLRGPRVRSKHAVEHIVERIMVSGDTTTDDLLMYFPEDDVHKPSQGRFGQYAEEEWFEEMAGPNLKALPCIKHKRGKWGFTGVDKSKFDDEHTRPLDDLRDDPQLKAEQTLDDLGLARDDEAREYLLAFHSELREQGTATSDELDGVTHRISFEELEGTFSELPGVEREANGPPEPEDIEIETYADVLEAQELVSESATVEWHYVGD